MFRFPSVSGKTYIVEWSSDLVHRFGNQLVTAQGTGGEIEISDPGATGAAQRFYRIRTDPWRSLVAEHPAESTPG